MPTPQFPGEVRFRFIPVNGSPISLDPASDGFVGQFTRDGEFHIEFVPSDPGCLVLREPLCMTQDGLRDGSKRLLEPVKSNPDGKSWVFQMKVPVFKGKRGLTTKCPTNNLKVVQILKKGRSCEFRLWEVAIITQGSNFFATIQLTYASKIYRNGSGQIVMPDYPGFSEWPALNERVATLIDKDTLPRYKKIIYGDSRPMPEGLGQVVWFNKARQIGLVGTSDGPRKIFWGKIGTPERYKGVEAGQMVTILDSDFENVGINVLLG